MKNTRRYHLLRKYGITEDQYDHLYRTQNGCCAVCERHSSNFRTRLFVDHDHSSGEIRGLLCNYCNRRIIGRHRKELGAALLQRGYDYLNKEYTGWIVPAKRKKRKKKRGKKRRIHVRKQLHSASPTSS